MNKILDLQISYPDFQLNQIIDPEQTDTNNLQIVNKINAVILAINSLTQGTTGASEIPIATLPEFPTASNIQTALQQIATFTKTNKVTIDQLLAKGTTQEQDITSLKSRMGVVETKNTSQDSKITALEGRATAVEAKNATQDSTLSTHGTRLSALEQNTYNKSEVDSKFSNHNLTGHDDKYYRKNEVYNKDEIGRFLKGGDTSIIYEVYTIINPLIVDELGKKTFTYRDNFGGTYTGDVLEDGTQVFDLKQGYVNIGLNRIEVTINDTLTRSVASGGLREISETKMGLTSPEGAGTELTFKYYQRIDLQGQYQVYIGSVEPPFKTNTLWFKTL